jgi:adenylate cyclase
MSQTRRLAAILAADVAGYSRLIGADEGGTLERLKALRRELLDPKIAEHQGRLVKTTGDGLLIEFGSVVDALRCAVEVQREMAGRNAGVPPGNRIELRIGINVGDVVVEDGDIFGDGVNVAARLEGLAKPGGICVSARVQEDAAGKLDLAFEDIGEQQLKNITRPVRVYRVRPEGPLPSPPLPGLDPGITAEGSARTARVGAAPPLALPLPDKPSIAVLPFANMSGDPEQEYFVDGMVEEIITALSRIHWLFVIARNSSLTYKGQAVDVKQVGRELGVRYVLEGSVRKAGGRVRITAQLIDALSGAHLWADRFDGPLEDVFELQDQVAVSVAGIIEPALQVAEMRRSAARPTADLTAYDLYLRALSNRVVYDKDHTVLALDLLEQAIERDPQYGPALALAAECHHVFVANDWSGNQETDRREGVRLARQAIRFAGDDPGALGKAAVQLGFFGENIDGALALIDRSLALNPSFAEGWYHSGVLRNWAGQPDLAITHFETSLRLNPLIRKARHLTGIGVSHFLNRRFEEAVARLVVSLEEIPTWAVTYRFLSSCYAHMGRLDEARQLVERLRAITPVVIPDASYLRNPEHRELFLSGLRLAAGEAG